MYEKIKSAIREHGIGPVEVYVENEYLTIEMPGFWLRLWLSRDEPSPDDFRAVPKNSYFSYWDMMYLYELNKISGKIKTLWWQENRFSPEIIEQAQ